MTIELINALEQAPEIINAAAKTVSTSSETVTKWVFEPLTGMFCTATDKAL